MAPRSVDDRVQRLEDRLFAAEQALLSVLPEPIVDLLSGSTATTVDEVSAWGEHVAATLLAMANAKPGPEMGDRADIERAYCPACGGGTSAAYQRGFQVPEGLLLHLRGERGAHECPVVRVFRQRELDLLDDSIVMSFRKRRPSEAARPREVSQAPQAACERKS